MKHLSCRLAPLLAATLLATGCASAVHSAHDDLNVVTDPPGAIARVGDLSVVTPGRIQVKRRKEPVVVRVEKDGFLPKEVVVGWHRSGAVWTNVVSLAGGSVWTAASSTCISLWGGPCHADTKYAPLIVGAALTAAATAIDLSTDRSLSLDRDDVVLRLEPVRLPEAPKGELR